MKGNWKETWVRGCCNNFPTNWNLAELVFQSEETERDGTRAREEEKAVRGRRDMISTPVGLAMVARGGGGGRGGKFGAHGKVKS
jgi:hypothetical protein